MLLINTCIADVVFSKRSKYLYVIMDFENIICKLFFTEDIQYIWCMFV